MVKLLNLDGREIDASSRPYVIAEIGVNHEGSLDQAKRLIDLARDGGADAAKFQSYKAGTLASRNSPSYWDTSKEPTRSQYELFKKYDSFGPDEYVQLAEHCREAGIVFVSTPFDDGAIDFLDPLMPFFKIASADLTNVPFLRKVAAKGKPVLLSTGASTLGEIDVAVEALTRAGCQDIVLLHCVLNYPTENCNAHLRMIEGLRRAYPEHIIGYSDHTLPDNAMTALVSAYLLGAVVLEKHFTHDKTLPGNDHYHAMDVADLKRFLKLSQTINELLGSTSHKAPTPTEALARKNARRSIVLATDVNVGETLNAELLTYKRPATGVSPLHWDEVIGRKVSRSLEADHVLQWEDLAQETP
ncbi:MAG: N-acetylneuraminate synthase family protein [Candidatus Accumulibacter sp.]|uniref:N-acetylneuraminate synthase family protein n=1 Tax=Accumulibacter sp. TaxID=2053492 RepID=UPI00258297A0|nr:N-acetylneuraminate synthase family protein [Accumulibacter sp.]MCM8622173.1 N-acetylneuraminate synthase family protein [Accumulibacter sp.]